MTARKDPLGTGVVLIAVGLAFYALQNSYLDEIPFLLGIGAAFIVAFVHQRSYGYLVPGGILTGIGLGMLFERGLFFSVADPMQLGIGLGFLLIYVLDSLVTRTAGGWWPLIPGGILTFVGLAQNTDYIEWFFRGGWSLVLVAIGLVLVVRGIFGRVTGSDASPPVPPSAE